MSLIKVAVIGAGGAGLCALRHLVTRPETFTVKCFEQSSRIGGTWVYTDSNIDDGFLSSSMYKNLMTNLPKEIMAFPDFAFDDDIRSFPHHPHVLEYLENYCQSHELNEFIEFDKRVISVRKADSVVKKDSWIVGTASVSDDHGQLEESEKFDAVMICNGHYSVPNWPVIDGQETFTGMMLHSHTYREPTIFNNMVVVCLGAGNSGIDIAMEIKDYAKSVIISHNHDRFPFTLPHNVTEAPGIKNIEKKSVIFMNDESFDVDAILFCTGYKFDFSFMSDDCKFIVEDERIVNLYKQCIHTKYPSLSTIGVCKRIVPFRQFDAQVQYVLSTLEGIVNLPSQEEMESEISQIYDEHKKKGLKPDKVHWFYGDDQWDYNDELLLMSRCPLVPTYVRRIYKDVVRERAANPIRYKNFNYSVVGNEFHKNICTDS